MRLSLSPIVVSEFSCEGVPFVGRAGSRAGLDGLGDGRHRPPAPLPRHRNTDESQSPPDVLRGGSVAPALSNCLPAVLYLRRVLSGVLLAILQRVLPDVLPGVPPLPAHLGPIAEGQLQSPRMDGEPCHQGGRQAERQHRRRVHRQPVPEPADVEESASAVRHQSLGARHLGRGRHPVQQECYRRTGDGGVHRSGIRRRLLLVLLGGLLGEEFLDVGGDSCREDAHLLLGGAVHVEHALKVQGGLRVGEA